MTRKRTMQQNIACTDAANCAPAACGARMGTAYACVCLDTAMCAVSFFVMLLVVLVVSVRLVVGLVSLAIIGLLVAGRQERAKSVFAEISNPA